jgi:hypothetical protein
MAMTRFGSRPKEDYIMKAEWKQLYALTEHWQSDLLFHRDEIKFLHHLVNKYVMWLTRYEEVEMVRQNRKLLAAVRTECQNLLDKVEAHLGHLSDLMENPFAHDSQAFRREHGELEDEIAVFAKHFRQAKKETFKITEHLMDSVEVAERV